VGYLVSYDDAPPYAHTIPILLKHLARDDYSGHTFMCLAAALGIPEARVHWDELVRLFKTTNVTTHPQKKSNIAQTLGTLATRKQLAEVIDILKDPSHGASARRQLAFPVLKSRSQMALQCRADLRDDPDIGEFMNRKKLFADDDD
jgi:HEAT repeat protein